jgi:hypothetical protein
MVTRATATPSAPRVLYICGTTNQTTQLHAVATQLGECHASFTPFYSQGIGEWAASAGLLESTIIGEKLRSRCLDYLRDHDLPIDHGGRSGPYDLVVTCTDLQIPRNVPKDRLVVVQEGMLDTETLWSACVDRLRLPPYLSGTTLTGTRARYALMCVASEGFRRLLIARGAPAHKLRVTGIPNFDDCKSFQKNRIAHRDYVLVCTSDLRETWRIDHRKRFLRRAVAIAAGRPLHVKFHPNEDQARARRELLVVCPEAHIHGADERTEELIANCSVLITQVSSVTFVGLALDKEVHSDLDLVALRRLTPLQNGATSCRNIAEVCRELLRLPSSSSLRADPASKKAHA